MRVISSILGASWNEALVCFVSIICHLCIDRGSNMFGFPLSFGMTTFFELFKNLAWRIKKPNSRARLLFLKNIPTKTRACASNRQLPSLGFQGTRGNHRQNYGCLPSHFSHAPLPIQEYRTWQQVLFGRLELCFWE